MRGEGGLGGDCKATRIREKYVEQRLIQAVRQCGGLALKFVSPGFNGVPDRLLLFMGGKVAFVEVKAPGESPRPLQAHRMEQLRRMGFKVYVLDSAEDIDNLVSDVAEGARGRSESPRRKEAL
jgi:hypothetical protein